MNTDPKVSQLLEKYRPHVVTEMAGELLFRYEDAINILADCEKLNLIIIAADFWEDVDDYYRELIVEAGDLSNIANLPDASSQTISALKELIKNGFPRNANYISFILKDNNSTNN